MLDSIHETRAVRDGLHNIMLEMSEDVYNTFYDNISEANALDILKQYLNYHQDDAAPKNVKIRHNRVTHTINIYADLHYLGNDKTLPGYYADDVIDGG